MCRGGDIGHGMLRGECVDVVVGVNVSRWWYWPWYAEGWMCRRRYHNTYLILLSLQLVRGECVDVVFIILIWFWSFFSVGELESLKRFINIQLTPTENGDNKVTTVKRLVNFFLKNMQVIKASLSSDHSNAMIGFVGMWWVNETTSFCDGWMWRRRYNVMGECGLFLIYISPSH